MAAGRPTKPVVIDQQGGGYILKELTEEEFWELGRERFYNALREVNEQARVIEDKKRARMNDERVNVFNASISERQQEREAAQSRYWQLDMHDIIMDRGIRD